LTQALLVHDVGPDVGLGHKRRMEALAAALEALGVTARVAPVSESDRAPLVVVDSYRWRADDGERFAGTCVAAVDDLERDLAVDLVVDPSPGAATPPASSSGLVLAGPHFALVGSDLRDLDRRPIGDRVASVLVATGAADTAGHGPALAEAVARLLPATNVRLVVGPWGAGAPPSGVDIVCHRDGLGPDLAAADVVLTAGGVTMLEALCLGRPTIAIVTAANQRRAVVGASRAGALEATTVEGAPGAVARLADDTVRRHKLAMAATALVDGRGAMRVAKALVALT
jgi:spore coat polysaccharide biosynthesis predicted glycosyltransferase SpsG